MPRTPSQEEYLTAEYDLPAESSQILPPHVPDGEPAEPIVQNVPKPSSNLGQRLDTSEKTRIDGLELREFRLDLRGQALLVPSTVSKPASLHIKMTPVPDTALGAFSIREAKMILAGTAIELENVSVTMHWNGMTLSVGSGDTASAIFVSLEGNILSDGDDMQHAAINDQLFYLLKKDAPYRLSLDGALTYSP